MDELLQKIFTKDYNFKIKILLYIIIISFNEDFFSDKNIIINEEEFLKVIYEKILNLINENQIKKKKLNFINIH